MSANTTTPSWPSLYNPGLEILHIEHHASTQPGGAYLSHPNDIFKFTFYWTLVFYTPAFLVCGLYAFWNYAFPPSPRTRPTHHLRESYSFSSMTSRSRPTGTHLNSGAPFPVLPKTNERRSRAAFALIVLFTFLTLSVAGAVIGSAIMGFVTAGLFKAANFNMSTWIPFLLAVMQVMVGLLSIWPSIVEII